MLYICSENDEKNMKKTRGIRNNNPLNIRYSGGNAWRGKLLSSMRNDKDFEEFVSMDFGFLAALNLIGNTYMLRHRLSTPSAIIARWAPATENNTDGYIKTVCRMTGLGGEEHISNHDTKLRDLVWAMAHVESGEGIELYRDDLNKAWAAFEPKTDAPGKGRPHS